LLPKNFSLPEVLTNQLKYEYPKVIFMAMVLVCLLFQKHGLAQSDSTFVANLKSELSLNQVQSALVDTLYKKASIDIRVIDKEIMSLSRKSIVEEDKKNKIAALELNKKNIKETRDLSVKLLLSADQKKIYDEKIKPSKPAVLHMGLTHDRASCTVCIPK
jgi:PIN domain nuclease of toxin-antitoxin system